MKKDELSAAQSGQSEDLAITIPEAAPDIDFPKAQPKYLKRDNRIRPLTAWRALKEIMKDKEDTKQAFIIIDALSGKSLEKSFKRMLKHENGDRIFYMKRELVPILENSDWLETLPEGSVGRTYLDFIRRENISAQGLVDEGEEAYDLKTYTYEDDDLGWFGRRSRDSHDLWHVLTGYGRDGLGELCLLAFSYEQSKSYGFKFMANMGVRMGERNKEDRQRVWACAREAYRNGKACENLYAQDIVDLLHEDLGEARKRLNLNPPVEYKEMLKAIIAENHTEDVQESMRSLAGA